MQGGESAQPDFEAVLEQEGLAPVDDGAGLHWRTRVSSARDIAENAAAVDAWRAWAESVERMYPFRKRSQRNVWRLYAQGVPVREIQTRCGFYDRNEVHRTIANIKSKSPPGPPNPWYRGEAPTTERTSMPSIRTLHYDQIALNRPIKKPGSMAPLDVFNNVDGIPHAGGIDVEFGEHVVLVTWSNIKSAVRKAAAE